ncbi:MAG: hypothetical protein GKR92_02120 [Gammaproteobacteria bacterium]|nr:MAG: hypothetical protein GKR92_02120 [Gammaproteobacteria bacterium]
MQSMKITFLIIFIVISCAASFWLGGKTAINRVSKTIDGMQTQLAFGHKKTYDEIYADLNNGCKKAALSRLSFAMDEQMMLMADYFQSNNDSRLEDYIKLRDPNLINTLHSYKVDWKKTWKISPCN